MRNVYFLLCALLILIFCTTNSIAQGSCADGSYQWSDIQTIFQNNGCSTATCHGGGAGGLDLTTFAGFNTGGTKCATEIFSGTTLVDIIQVGGVVCANGTVANAMNNNIANPVSADDIAAIQAYIDGGSFQFCPGDPLDDGVCTPPSTIGSLVDPGQTTLCSDGSDAITFALPTGSLPDVQIVIEVNGVLTTISDDGSFDTSILMDGDEVCYTAFTFDLAAINGLLTSANTLCPIVDCDALFGIPGVTQAISDLVNGINDGNPGLNDLQEALDFAGSFGNPIGSVQTAGSTLDALNVQIGTLLGNVCYASSEAICLNVVACGPNTCPTVILNDNNLPNLPPAVCTDDNLSLCFDVSVDEATFDPALVEFNYELLIDGTVSTVTLNTSYVSGGGIDPAASGQLCFETIVPASADPCSPYELSLEITSVFYNDVDCPNNFVAYDLNLTTPLPIMQTGDNLNDLVPLLGIAGLNPILVQIYPNPNWTANVTQAPACDGTTLGIIEILAADGATVCETLTGIGSAGMDGCPPTDAILPETLYENYTTYTDADGMEQPNPCAISITVPEQTISCEDQCINCPTVVNVIPPDEFCYNFLPPITFCVEFDMMVDANTVLTVDGTSVDGSAGGTQICVDFDPYIPIIDIDPCGVSVIAFTATAICGGTDLLDGITWLDTQILPLSDPQCGGISGCMDVTACNYVPYAVCDDPNNPCIPAPTCNTDPCLGNIEIVDPNDACACIVDQVQVLGCTDPNATNYNSSANCDDGNCMFEMCNDPCAPNFGAQEACEPYDMTCNTDCTLGDLEVWDTATCSCIVDIPTVLGCTDSNATNYDSTANCDDGNCMFEMCDDPCAPNFGAQAACDAYDDSCNADCTTGPFGGTWDPVTCACVNETAPVNGCTDPTASNFDPNANCDDGSCNFIMCDDPCAPNFGAAEDCEPYNDTCNTDCTAGPFGGSWNPATCACINQITPVTGCTDPTASNYNSNANCDDGSCFCEEEIVGSIITPDEGCDVSGLEIMIMAPDGTSITVTTDANGSFIVPGGPFPCGTYAATITDANVPPCFLDTGNIGPVQFVVDGQGNGNDGPLFIANPAVPTLSQWGLMILALLLMTFGALKLGFQNTSLQVN